MRTKKESEMPFSKTLGYRFITLVLRVQKRGWRRMSSPAGGPPIHPRPTANGFGNTILLESGKPFGGQATIDFNPNGLIFELRLPLKAITERASSLINHKDVGEPS
ncbi:MAG: hypothetical protein C0511_07110 [Hyphomicrobium sp.]|nr:hypothetical protein [Hyphomicrobium sp.]